MTIHNAVPDSLVPVGSRAGVALITVTVLASGVASFNAFGANIVVPAIAADFGAGFTAVQWTVTGHLLAVAALLIVGGVLAERVGRRPVFAAGLVVVFVASAACAFAPSIHWLIAGRVAQGVGAALVVPISLTLLNSTLLKGDRAKGIAIWAGLSTLVSTVVPYAGGLLVDHTSWRWVFLLPLPLIALALAALWQLPAIRDKRRSRSTDFVGALILVFGLGGVIYALTEAPAAGWSSTPVLVALGLGASAFLALLPFERRHRSPMVRLSLFESRQLGAVNAVTFLVYGALSVSGFLFVVVSQLKLGYTAAQSGAAFIPTAVLFVALAPLSGALVSRIGPRWVVVNGMVLVAASLLWLAKVRPGSGYVDTVLPAVVAQGIGLGLMIPPLTAVVLAAVHDHDHDLAAASAFNDATAKVGAVVAVALVPVLIGVTATMSLAEALTDGYRIAMITAGGACLAAAVLAAVFVTDERMACPSVTPSAPHQGCALADQQEVGGRGDDGLTAVGRPHD